MGWTLLDCGGESSASAQGWPTRTGHSIPHVTSETRLVSVTHTGDAPFWTFWEMHLGRAVASRARGSVDYGGASFIGTFAEVG